MLPNEVVQWQDAAQVEGDAPHIAARRIYLDGSGVHPKTPEIRAVAWAIAWKEDQSWHHAAGGVDRAQTVARAELLAALKAAEATQGPVKLISDCSMVVKGCHSLQRSTTFPRWADTSLVSDLWQRLWRTGRLQQITVRCMRAHQHKPETGDQETLQDWEGNNQADNV